MGILDFLSHEAGQQRRKALDETLGNLLDINHYIPPNSRGRAASMGNLLAMLNPVNDMEQAAVSGRQMMGPGQTPGQRFGHGLDMATNVAAVAAPVAGVKYADDAGRVLAEVFTGVDAMGRQAAGNALDAGKRFAADESGALFPSGATMDDVLDFAKSGDAIYHSGPVGAAEEMHKWGVDPSNDGPWITEIAQGAINGDIDDFLSQNPPAAWWSDAPDWVKAKVSRATGNAQSDVTADDIRQHGHLAIASASDYADDAFRIGDDGLFNGEYSEVTTLGGDRMKLYETPLYEHGGDGVGRYPFGIERNEIVTGEAIEPRYTLTGDELVEFLRKRGEIPAPQPTPEAQRGEEILSLLKSGNGDKVTDEMLDMGDPVANAKLNQYLFENYDLPMDEASRMARADEMGFDTDAYHATRADFSEFKPGWRGSNYFAAEPENAISGAIGGAADNSHLAALPGHMTGPTAIMPVNVRGDDVSRLRPPRQAWGDLPETNFFQNLDDAVKSVDTSYWYDVYDEIPDDFGGFKYVKKPYPEMKYSPTSRGWNGDMLPGWNSGSDVDSLARVRGNGQKGFLVSDEAGASIVAGEDMPIRSRFARFDPRLAHLRNLSAGVGGAGLLSYLVDEESNQDELRNYLGI